MTQLEILTEYENVLRSIFQNLSLYNNYIRNELFEIEPNENNQIAYRRGETIYDKCDHEIGYISTILNKEHEILQFLKNVKKINRN